MTIKYKYALIGDGKIIEIDSVLKSDHKKIFTCIECGKQLTPALGNIRQHHFRHKIDENCSPESYLHKLAKLRFYETYKNCRDNNLPFFINFFVKQKCTFHEGIPRLSCSKPVEEKHDLTEFFPTIDMEASHGEFIPDILLQSTKGMPLYVEFKVSHSCTQDKINSGNKIIEITISCEEDIDSFCMGELTESPKVKFINFVQERTGDHCQGKCNPSSDAFIVYPNGKSRLLTNFPLPDIARAKKGSTYFEWVDCDISLCPDSYLSAFYKAMNVKSFLAGVPVKNCFLCRYHAMNFYESGVYCKYLKRSTISTFASECRAFRPDPSVFSEYLETFDEYSPDFSERSF